MRWTAEHWAKLDKEERSMLMELLKTLGKPSYTSAFMPDDVSLCPSCGEPYAFCFCYELLQRFTAKMGVPCPDI